ncbi:hypothetical protein E2C01_032790 [Portunus trituberculatus]|uniref:Uncharacterized protein n=1 Tax=Portunus trituberculatus TaxID=210409 RepID=A0A5B7EWU1_PORTR|nr:hypothetical protein [Portunus trituberculatus]
METRHGTERVEVSRALNLMHLTASANAHAFPLLRYLVLSVDRFGYVTAVAARLRSPVSNPDLLLSVLRHINELLTMIILMWSRGEESVRTTVFEVVNKMDSANLTHSLVPWVSHARRLRVSSWCMTIAVVSDDQTFLTAFAEVSDRTRLIVWEMRLLVVTKLAIPLLRSLLRNYWDFSMMNTLFLKQNDISKNG